MPAYAYLVRRQLKIGNEVKQPGELISEPASWPGLDAYISQGWVEPIADLDESERKRAVHRASPRPQTYAPSGPERPPTPVREASRFPGPEGTPEQQSVRCSNCREISWLDASLTETIVFSCWRCNQLQSLRSARDGSPIGIEEINNSLDARRPVEWSKRS